MIITLHEELQEGDLICVLSSEDPYAISSIVGIYIVSTYNDAGKLILHIKQGVSQKKNYIYGWGYGTHIGLRLTKKSTYGLLAHNDALIELVSNRDRKKQAKKKMIIHRLLHWVSNLFG